MGKAAIVYGVALALLAAVLQWLHWRYALRQLPTELYVLIVAIGFTVLGVVAGRRFTRAPAEAGFVRNDAALATLGISERQYEVLELLAQGLTNQQIADKLFVSPNTIKSHVAQLFAKLDVQRRTQAIARARELGLIA